MTDRHKFDPELECDVYRTQERGYWETGKSLSVRCLEHGYPTPLARWHYHEELELHLIVAGRGQAFVGDYIGPFEPGHLVLVGPNLPHNWISTDVPAEGYPLRDMVLQFSDEPIRHAAKSLKELEDCITLLDRARNGIEFFGISDMARKRYERIRASSGCQRLSHFVEYLSELAACNDYRLLSTARLQSQHDDVSMSKISGIVNYLTENLESDISMAEVCAGLGMTESAFSRFFRRGTGNTFTDFVNRLRINKACLLLMDTDRYITSVCFDVGFNNIANFNRRFLQLKGMTPREFRRQASKRFGRSSPAGMGATMNEHPVPVSQPR